MTAEDIKITEGKRLADEELPEDEAEDSEEEKLHYEGDIEVEDMFEMEEEDVNVVVGEEPPTKEPAKGGRRCS